MALCFGWGVEFLVGASFGACLGCLLVEALRGFLVGVRVGASVLSSVLREQPVGCCLWLCAWRRRHRVSLWGVLVWVFRVCGPSPRWGGGLAV